MAREKAAELEDFSEEGAAAAAGALEGGGGGGGAGAGEKRKRDGSSGMPINTKSSILNPQPKPSALHSCPLPLDPQPSYLIPRLKPLASSLEASNL
jgi:hypothetical protein